MAVPGVEPVSTADLKMACDALGDGIQSAQQAASAAQSTASAAQAAAGTAQSDVDGLDGRVTALEGKVVPPLEMFPIGSVLLFLHSQSRDPGTYLGGSWHNDGLASIGGTSYAFWRRFG